MSMTKKHNRVSTQILMASATLGLGTTAAFAQDVPSTSGAATPVQTAPAVDVPAAPPPAPTPAPAPAAQMQPGDTVVGAGRPSESLPPPRSDNDPAPPVASPTLPTAGVTKQAGVGGTQAYGRAGVLELGGSGGFAAASNFSRYEVSPSIGLFVLDNIELSLLTAFNHFRIGANGANGETSATELKALIEPSIHLPFSSHVFGFLGVGAGVNYITGQSAGFALQPRIGANFLVGRSGVFTPSFNVAYSTVEAMRTPAGTLLAVQTSYGLNLGYTVMW